MIDLRQTAEFNDWTTSLRGIVDKGRIAQRLVKLRHGHFGDFRSVGGGVSELRFHFGPGYRVYFTRRQRDGVVIILLASGHKDSQTRDIVLAKRLAARSEDSEDLPF